MQVNSGTERDEGVKYGHWNQEGDSHAKQQ